MNERERCDAATRELIGSAALPWDRLVEFWQVGEDLRVTAEQLSLRDAVRRFLVLPLVKRQASGVSLHAPLLASIGGKPVAIGFINYDGMLILVERFMADR